VLTWRSIHHILQYQSSIIAGCCICTPSVSPVLGHCLTMIGVEVRVWLLQAATRSRVDSAVVGGRLASASFSEQCTLMMCSPVRLAALLGAPADAVGVPQSSWEAEGPGPPPWTTPWTPRSTSATAADLQSALGAVSKTTTTLRRLMRFLSAQLVIRLTSLVNRKPAAFDMPKNSSCSWSCSGKWNIFSHTITYTVLVHSLWNCLFVARDKQTV